MFTTLESEPVNFLTGGEFPNVKLLSLILIRKVFSVQASEQVGPDILVFPVFSLEVTSVQSRARKIPKWLCVVMG